MDDAGNSYRIPYRLISLSLLLLLVGIMLWDRAALYGAIYETRTGVASMLGQGAKLENRMAHVEGATRLHAAIAATPEERKIRVLDLALRALDDKIRDEFEERLGREWLQRKRAEQGIPTREMPGQGRAVTIYPRPRDRE